MDFNKYLNPVNAYLEEQIVNDAKIPKSLSDSMFYSIKAGGKRFRPVFLLSIINSYTKDFQLGVSIASAIEMIHTYSLIHDDLPCMDDDDLRRGLPTNHKVFGEGLATLAGDALLTDAFLMITKADLSSDQKIKIVELLSKHAGSRGMIKGQILDLESENKKISKELLLQIHHHKTADLLIFCALAGGIISEVTSSQLDALENMANYMGLAFQVKDDLLDVYGSTIELGKQVGSDEFNHKSTYVTLYGKEKSEELLREYTKQAKHYMNLANFNQSNEIEFLIDYLVERNK